ncbi:MAG: aminoacyl-tRNA hydrolase [Planctomycetes bacterium]|nr:aminoacyl-tRNA hydrolase [Planctomycetota bacterium]
MLVINHQIQIPESELLWKFVRSGGPGGQNVNKVASKAVLFWNLAATSAVPDEIKPRIALQQKRFVTKDGTLVIASQRYRDQDRNRQDCLEKLRGLLLQACARPKTRKATRPTRSSRRARLQTKKHRSTLKSSRRAPGEES